MSPQPRRRSEIGEFLAARRAEVTPEQAGLAPGLGQRRVPGLRREEVAMLAGISVEYYAKLERGTVGAVSAPVLQAVARVLGLDGVQTAHLETLARHSAGVRPVSVGSRRSHAGADAGVRPELQRVLDLLEPAAAFVRTARLDVVATNATARVLYAGVLDRVGAPPGEPPNLARYLFQDERSRQSYGDWGALADHAVGTLRAESGRHPDDAALHQLVDDLLATPDFRQRWESHQVRRYEAGRQGFGVGGRRLDLDYEALDVVGSPGLTLLVYSAATGSRDAEVLAGLARDAHPAGE